jgi:hypothetical protein
MTIKYCSPFPQSTINCTDRLDLDINTMRRFVKEKFDLLVRGCSIEAEQNGIFLDPRHQLWSKHLGYAAFHTKRNRRGPWHLQSVTPMCSMKRLSNVGLIKCLSSGALIVERLPSKTSIRWERNRCDLASPLQRELSRTTSERFVPQDKDSLTPSVPKRETLHH